MAEREEAAVDADYLEREQRIRDHLARYSAPAVVEQIVLNAESQQPEMQAAVFDVSAAKTQWTQMTTFATQMQHYTQQAYQKGVIALEKHGKVEPIKVPVKKSA